MHPAPYDGYGNDQTGGPSLLTESEAIAANFYEKLGPRRMAARFSPQHTEDCVRLVLSFCSRGDRLLDAACGTGRISVPLANEGLHVAGVDLSPEMIDVASAHASESGCQITFATGSLLRLPFPERSFDRVFCYRAFSHLLKRSEQIRALEEMIRVLDVDGIAMIETSDGESRKRREHFEKHGRGPDGRVVEPPVEGLINTGYIHDKTTLERLASESGAARYHTKFVRIDHRRRITLWLWK